MSMRGRISAIWAILALGNILVWAGAVWASRHSEILLASALLAYLFGLRHAVDADHIAAIDNVTRKLIQQGERPVAVGFFFSLGHSTVVVLGSLAIVLAASRFHTQLEAVQRWGTLIGTAVSVGFLLVIAVANLVVLSGILRTFRQVRDGGSYVEQDLAALLAGRGLLARVLRPLVRLISASWQMYPLGVLFGLGFDTATEIGVLGMSAASASHGVPIWSIMLFPLLFTAGMTLIDSADNILMLGAYAWAFAKPVRKLYYNITITAVSVLIALLVGAIEALGIVASELGATASNGWWSVVTTLNDHFGIVGFGIIGVFVACFLLSMLVYRLRGYDRLAMRRT